MFLALKEIRRAKVRFSLLVAAIALLVFLILFFTTIQNGLITAFVGAVRNQSAPVLVYSVDGRRTLQASIVTPDLEAKVRAVEGIGRVGRLGQGTFGVTAGGKLQGAAVIGYDTEGLGSPSAVVKGRLPAAVGEVVASEADAPSGFDVGDIVTVVPGSLQLTVVGLARDVQLNVLPTLFGSFDTYAAAVASRNPDAGAPLPSALALEPASGITAGVLVARVNAASDDADALTRAAAANKTPGVSQVRQSFLSLFVLYGLVVPLLTGLFFLIITFQKASALTLLRAVGASAGVLVRSLLVQVAIVVGAGYLLGTLLYAPLTASRIGKVPVRFETGAVVFWAVLLFVCGVVSSLVAVRRVMRIDPLTATTGGGVGL
jgi:putative ABC transport system permease protein